MWKETGVETTMLTFLKRDVKDEAKIQRKRLLEEERKKRIFNPRTRLIGVDTNAWEAQLNEKQNQVINEHLQNEEQIRRLWIADQLAIVKEQEHNQHNQKVKKELNTYRKLYQNRQSTREFDLNRPDYLKNQFVGTLKLLGEDETFMDRKHYQTNEQKAWLLQQTTEKEAERIAENTANRNIALKQEERDRRAVQIASLDEECRRKVEEARKQFNKLQVQENLAKQRFTRQNETLKEAVEINNWINGSLLNEDPDIAVSAWGPGRIRPECFKGAPVDEKMNLRRFQQSQIEESMRRKQDEKDADRRWALISAKNEQICLEKEIFREKVKRKVHQGNVATNKAIASTRQHRQIQGIVEPPSAEFFNQFNQSSY